MKDVAIVGGGPAGSACAALLAHDHDVTVYEEHSAIGRPVQCAGLLSDEAIRLTGVRPDILSVLYGAEVVFPGGGTVRVRSEKPKANAIDRAQLDFLMAGKAMDAGAEYRLGERIDSFQRSSDSIRLADAGYRLLIGADGHASAVSASIGDNDAPMYLRGIQADISGSWDLDDTFRIRLGSRYSPGFMLWEIPCGDFTRVGLCVPQGDVPHPYLKRYLSDMGLEGRVSGMVCGRIPIGFRRTITSERIMLIGDAASQVKPISAGGIYPTMSAAPLLADVAHKALDEDDLSADRLRAYDTAVDSAIGASIRRGMTLRRMMMRMDDADMDKAGRYAARPEVTKILDGIDIDDPSLVVRDLLRKPSTAIGGVATLLRCIV